MYRRFDRAFIRKAALLGAAAASLFASLPAQAGSWVNGSYTNSYGTRTYRMWVPTGYVPGQAIPMVVALHGCQHTPNDFANLTRINTLADAQKFFVLYPAQSSAANPALCWNYFDAANQARGAGEPSIIAGIVLQVRAGFSVNAQKNYVMGISAGGGLAAIMADCYPEMFAGVGVVSGLMYKATINAAQSTTSGSLYDPRERGYDGWVCGIYPTGRKMPSIVFQGSADTYVTPVNASQLITQATQFNDFMDDGLNNGTVLNVATSTTTGSAGGKSYTLKKYSYGGKEIANYYLIDGLKHTWSGGDPAYSIEPDTAGPDTTTIMWTYLQQFSI